MKETINTKIVYLSPKKDGLKKDQFKIILSHSDTEVFKLSNELEVQKTKLEILNKELQLAKEQTKIAVNKYTELYDFAPSGYFTLSQQGNIIELNPIGSQMLGQEHLYLEDCPFVLFVSDNSKPIFNLFLQEIFNHKEERTCEVFLTAKNNIPICVSLSGIVNENGKQCFVTAINITQGRQAEHDARKANEKLEATLEALPDLMFEVGPDGFCYDFHSPNSDLFFLQADNIIGKAMSDIFPCNISDVVMSAIAEAHKKGFSIGKQLEMKMSDESVWYEIYISSKVSRPEELHFILLMRDVTKSRLNEVALLRNEAKHRKMVANIGDVIVIIDKEGISRYKSPNIEKWFGWKPEEVIGISIFENIFPEDQVEVKKFIDSLLDHPDISGKIQFRYRCKNDRFKWIEFTAVNLLHDADIQGILGNYHDISERIQAERQFKLLSTAVEQSPVTVVITDKEGNIEYVNPKFSEVTGYSFDEIEGKNPRLLKSGEQINDFYKELWETILSGKNWNGEFQNRKKNGDTFWESAVISPIVDGSGDIMFFLAIKEDITEKKKMLEDLIKAKDRAEESDRLKSSFLSNMSHEIRTPLNSIIGFSDLLNDPELDQQDIKEFTKTIKDSGNNLMNIVSDIMDLSMIEAGQMKIRVERFSLKEILTDLMLEFSEKTCDNGIELRINIPTDNNDVVIKSDVFRIRQIFNNLIGNALKFTSQGFIEIGYILRNNLIEFQIKDSGIGIAPQYHNTIFERFRQVDTTKSRNFGGNGLGLAISKNLVEILGGEIWVESDEEEGSTFYFTISTQTENEIKNSNNHENPTVIRVK